MTFIDVPGLSLFWGQKKGKMVASPSKIRVIYGHQKYLAAGHNPWKNGMVCRKMFPSF